VHLPKRGGSKKEIKSLPKRNMSSENGVQVINGTEPVRSRSSSPTRPEEQKPRRFLNGWTKEQERLMSEWSDIAMCYRWLHDRAEKYYNSKSKWITLPVIILSTLGGTANFGIQSIFSSDSQKQLASFAIGTISLVAGIMTTIGNYLRYAQLEESNRIASIAWGKFQRLIAVEISLHPNERIDSLDFLKICRADLDRLIEQSPPIHSDAIKLFETRFGHIKELKKPDICGALEHTRAFESSEERLKQIAVDAALLLKQRKKTLNEFLSPQIQERIKEQVDSRIHEAIQDHKIKIMHDLEEERLEKQRTHDDFEKMMEERQKRLEEEIEMEKKKIGVPLKSSKDLPMEHRMYSRHRPSIADAYDKRSMKTSPHISPQLTHTPVTTDVPEMELETATNEIVIPTNPLFQAQLPLVQAQLPLVQEEITIQVDTPVENEHHA
jgi:hypothetical protein